MKKRVLLPISGKNGKMRLAEIDSMDELKPGIYGIPEPEEGRVCDIRPDAAIVPALAFDRMGYRLGHGGGYYDRYFSEIDTYKIGLCRERLVYNRLPRDSFDIAVDCIVTEKEAARLC